MLGMTIGTALTCFFSFLLGYIVFRRNINSRVRYTFLLLSLSLGIWALIALFTWTTRDHSSFIVLFMTGTAFQMLHFAAFLHFSLVVCGMRTRNQATLFWIYIPCVFSILLFFANPDYVSEFILINETWHFNHKYDSAAFISMLVIWLGYYGFSFYLYIKKSRGSNTYKEKKLFQILAASVLALVALTLLEALVLPLLVGFPSNGRLLILKFLWLLCLGYLMDRYRFLTAPARLEDIALRALPGYVVIILDANFAVHKANQEATRILSSQGNKFEGRPLTAILPSADRLLEKLATDGFDYPLSDIISVGREENARIFLDIKVSPLHEKGAPTIGFMLVGKELKGRQYLNCAFNLSERELEIIEQIMRGHSNSKIAEYLFISKRTVATHITHIFRKLGVHNRIQLCSQLKDNQLLAAHIAEKKLLIDRKRE